MSSNQLLVYYLSCQKVQISFDKTTLNREKAGKGEHAHALMVGFLLRVERDLQVGILGCVLEELCIQYTHSKRHIRAEVVRVVAIPPNSRF